MSKKLAGKPGWVQWQTGRLSLKLAVLLTFLCGVIAISLTFNSPQQRVAAATHQKYQFILPPGISQEVWESHIPKNNPTVPSIR